MPMAASVAAEAAIEMKCKHTRLNFFTFFHPFLNAMQWKFDKVTCIFARSDFKVKSKTEVGRNRETISISIEKCDSAIATITGL